MCDAVVLGFSCNEVGGNTCHLTGVCARTVVPSEATGWYYCPSVAIRLFGIWYRVIGFTIYHRDYKLSQGKNDRGMCHSSIENLLALSSMLWIDGPLHGFCTVLKLLRCPSIQCYSGLGHKPCVVSRKFQAKAASTWRQGLQAVEGRCCSM